MEASRLCPVRRFHRGHQHMAHDAGIDQVMREHGHGEPGGAADLHGVRAGRTDSKMLGERGSRA